MAAPTPVDRREAERIVAAAVSDGRLERSPAEHLGASLATPGVLEAVLDGASESKRIGKGDAVSVSRNLFIPLTNLCRDRCAYCTFAVPSATKPSSARRSAVRLICGLRPHHSWITINPGPEPAAGAAR